MNSKARAALILIAIAAPLAAQVSVSGKVTDDTGAGIPDLKVTLTNQSTQVEKEIRTTPEGVYTIQAEPGTYALAIQKPGRGVFAIRDVQLAAGQNQTVNIGMSAQSDNRNFRYMFYGFVAAWLVLVIYVISMVSRENTLKRQVENLKQMLESEKR